MKILILEPFYTNFHIELANSLSGNIYSLVFNLGNFIYLKNAQKIVVHKNIVNTSYTPPDMEIAKSTKTLFTETLRKIDGVEPSFDDFEYMAKYISFLRVFLKDNKIKLVTMHNDLRWQHSLAIQVCKELDVKYLITERGLFRPDTTTIDFSGVNSYSSLSNDKAFYKKIKIKKYRLRNYQVSKLNNLIVNANFAMYILLNKVGDIFGLNTTIKNRSYSLSKYIRLFIKQKFSENDNDNGIKDLPKKYVYVPLQVNTDTQLLVHSDFNNMQDFISTVENAFYALCSDLKLVFKIHPMEKGINDYKFDTRSVLSNCDSKELVENCQFVITINSTVGFEAIQMHQQVVVLGEAFFKIDGIVIPSSQEKLMFDLREVLSHKVTIDNNLIDKFVFYLKFKYQINGSLFNWDNKTLEEVKVKIYDELL